MQTVHVARTNTTAQTVDYPQWATTEDAGADAEDVWSDHHTLKTVLKELESRGRTDSGSDLMKRFPDGALATEF